MKFYPVALSITVLSVCLFAFQNCGDMRAVQGKTVGSSEVPIPTSAQGFLRVTEKTTEGIGSFGSTFTDHGIVSAGSRMVDPNATAAHPILVGFDKEGGKVWGKSFGGDGQFHDVIRIPGLDAVLAVGYRTTAGSTNTDAFIGAFSALDGAPIFAKQLGELAQSEVFYWVHADASGYWVAGSATITDNDSDFLIARLDSTFNVVWVKTYGSIARERISRIISDGTGGAYFRGSRGVGILGSAVIGHIDSAGTVSWVRQFGNQSGEVGGLTLVGGDVVVSGSQGWGSTTDSLFVTRISKAGTLVWANTYDAGREEVGRAMLLQNGDLLVSGYRKNDLNSPSSPFVLLLDPFLGTFRGSTGIVSSDSMVLSWRGMHLDSSGDLFFTGTYLPTLYEATTGQFGTFVSRISSAGTNPSCLILDPALPFLTADASARVSNTTMPVSTSALSLVTVPTSGLGTAELDSVSGLSCR